MGENVYKYNIRLSDLIRLICVSSLPWDYTMLRAYQVWLIRKWVEELTLRLSWRQSFPWCWRLLLRLFWVNSLNIELTLTLSWRSRSSWGWKSSGLPSGWVWSPDRFFSWEWPGGPHSSTGARPRAQLLLHQEVKCRAVECGSAINMQILIQKEKYLRKSREHARKLEVILFL